MVGKTFVFIKWNKYTQTKSRYDNISLQ